MTTVKAFADRNQSGELFAIILNDLASPPQVWQGLSNLLQAINRRQEVFGYIVGELTVQDEHALDGYAKWPLSIPKVLTSLKNLVAEVTIMPVEGDLSTQPLVWLPESTHHLRLEDLRDPHGLRDTNVVLEPVVADNLILPSDVYTCNLSAYRLPQLPLCSPGNSALNLHVFYDEQATELSLSAQIWLDLWLSKRFDGSINEPWAEVNYRYLRCIFSAIAHEANGNLEDGDFASN